MIDDSPTTRRRTGQEERPRAGLVPTRSEGMAVAAAAAVNLGAHSRRKAEREVRRTRYRHGRDHCRGLAPLMESFSSEAKVGNELSCNGQIISSLHKLASN